MMIYKYENMINLKISKKSLSKYEYKILIYLRKDDYN